MSDVFTPEQEARIADMIDAALHPPKSPWNIARRTDKANQTSVKEQDVPAIAANDLSCS